MPVASMVGGFQPPLAPGQHKHLNPADVHVLLVDDEMLSRMVIGNLLKKCKYKVTVVESGVEALEVMKQQGPEAFNLVLTDVMMPDISGLELLQHVRKNGELQNVPVIMMSANECQDMVWNCVEQGAEDYLLKPLTKKEVQYIWQHVYRRQQQHARVPRLSFEDSDSMDMSSPGNSLGIQSAEAALHHSRGPSPLQPAPTVPLSLPAHPPDQQAPASFQPPSSSQGPHPSSAPQDSALQPPSHPLDSSMKKAALEARRASHARASSSQVPSSRGPPAPGAARATWSDAVAALPARDGASISLADYLAARGSSLSPAISFRIFCSLLNLIQTSHKEDHPCTLLRPSTLWLTADNLTARPGALLGSEPQQQQEQQLYASPEELAGQPRTRRSDMFGLAILFCVLFYGLDSITADGQIKAARLGRVPSKVEKGSPAAQFLGALLQPEPHRRPKLDQVLNPKMLTILHKSVMGGVHVKPEAPAAKPGKALHPVQPTLTSSQQHFLRRQAQEDAVDREVLADFLQQVRHAKQLEASNIRRQMAMLDTDIGSVGAFLNHQPRPASADLSAPRSCPLPTPASGVEAQKLLQMPLAGPSGARANLKPSTAEPQPPISQPRKRQKVAAAEPLGAGAPNRDLSQKLLWHKRRQQRAMADEEDDACDCDGPPQNFAPDGLRDEAPSSHNAGSSADRAERSQSQPEAIGGPHADSCKAHAASKPPDAPDVSPAQPPQQQRAASGSARRHEGSEARAGGQDHADAPWQDCAEQPRVAPPAGHQADQSLHEPAGSSSSDCARVLLPGSSSGTYKDGGHEKLGPVQQQRQQQQQAGSKRKVEESGVPGYDSDGSCSGSIDERWQRIAAAFSPLEDLFFHPELSAALRGRQASAAAAVPQASSPSKPHLGSKLEAFSEHLGKASCYGSFKVQATLNYGNLPNTANMVCSAAFDRDGEYFATAGVNRGIKVFEMAMVLDDSVSTHYPLLKIPARSKLSSLCWNGYIKSSLICADYDGVIQLWDIASASDVMQFDEHSRRVWSVDFSQTDPTCFLSGSDDTTVRLWSLRDEGSVATIEAHANVCSVQFSPVNSNLIAFGSANYKSFLYDMRQISRPLAVIAGHNRAVSYVRFMGASQLATASTDNTLKLWDIQSASSSPLLTKPLTTFSGHVNEKNFVGLSVTPDGYIACGSEDNSVYAYYKALPSPVTQHRFGCNDPTASEDYCFDPLESNQFMSSVCWSQKGHTLLAANSLGTIKLLQFAA